MTEDKAAYTIQDAVGSMYHIIYLKMRTVEITAITWNTAVIQHWTI
jgi:hypothetical protein